MATSKDILKHSNLYLEFTDAGDLIRIEPLHLMHPGAESYWDRNWIKSRVIIKGGVFTGQYFAAFMTTDFELLKQQLRVLGKDFIATAFFRPYDGQLNFEIMGDGLGHFDVSCKAIPEHLGTELSFVMGFDQTEIGPLVNQLNEITKIFPIDGDFQIRNEH